MFYKHREPSSLSSAWKWCVLMWSPEVIGMSTSALARESCQKGGIIPDAHIRCLVRNAVHPQIFVEVIQGGNV
jgi:hypothetical protein